MNESPELHSSAIQSSQKKSPANYPTEISSLPISSHLDEICSALKSSPSHFLILTAETAAGKSTAVPLALLKNFTKKIIMLEPRRLAAVAIANRVSYLLGEDVGKTAGYRLHLESKISSATRFEVMTEAILTRRLQNDPSLEDVSVVVIDEFHERSVHADLALAFLKESMQLRDDLYVIVMSATIDTEQLSAYLSSQSQSSSTQSTHNVLSKQPACSVLHIQGRQYPVTINYRPSVTPAQAANQCVAELINNQSLANERLENGIITSILVFLPGIYDINRTKSDLSYLLLQTGGSQIDSNTFVIADTTVQIKVLHSSIPFAEQKEIVQPQAPSGRTIRVILSSAIAETSLTVPGVSVVIDSGLARINRFDTATGMEKLTTESESVFSAEQRAGRAGRTGPGTCIRLWAQNDFRVTRTPPEILRTDLTSLVLECAQWGVTSLEKLSWLDTPSRSSWQNAHDLLFELGCIEQDGHITQTGTNALSLGIHPRLSCVALAGKKAKQEKRAAQIILAYTEYAESSPDRKKRFTEDLLSRLDRCSFPSNNSTANTYKDSDLLLAGFPDRIAHFTGQGACYQFPSGRIASLPKEDAVKSNTYPEWILAPEVDAGERTGKIYSYEVIDEHDALSWLFAHASVITKSSFADAQNSNSSSGTDFKLQKFEYTCYGKIILKEKKLIPTQDDFAAAVCSAVTDSGIKWLPLTDASESLLLRTEFFLEHYEPDDVSSLKKKYDSLSITPHEWLQPFLTGGSSKLSEETVYNALYWYLDGQTIDRMVPTEITLPNGKKRRISYEKREKQTNDSSKTNGSTIIPVLEVIIQQIFGCFETPKILGVPVLLKLLSPARRPLQITDDLAGFWVNTWPEICKEMKGRYPKHNWDYRAAENE